MAKDKSNGAVKSVATLGKTKVNLPSYSAMGLIKKASRGDYRLVREVQEREYVEDNRSLFFKEQFIKERKRTGLI